MSKLWTAVLLVIMFLQNVSCFQSQKGVRVRKAVGAVYKDTVVYSVAIPAKEVKWTFDAISVAAVNARDEIAVCLSEWTVGHGFVVIRKAFFASIASADSMKIRGWNTGTLCGKCPTVHWHVVRNGYERQPSDVDMETLHFNKNEFHVLGLAGSDIYFAYSDKDLVPQRELQRCSN